MKITVYKDKLKMSSCLRTEPIFTIFRGVVEPFFTFIALDHITIHFWHQAIAEHFDFLVGKVVMSETVLFKCRKWKKYMLKCLIISALLRVVLLWVHPRSAEWWMILTLVQLFLSPEKLFRYGEAFSKHSWYGEAFLLSIPGTFGCPFAGIPIFRVEVAGGVT